MRVPRIVRILLLSLFAVLFVSTVFAGLCWLYFHPHVRRVNGIVYGQREGRNLTLDVIRPVRNNGLGVALMVSGGWKSATPGALPTWMMAPLLQRGYTIFAVCHISQPEATVMQIVEDVNRAVRFIRHNAAHYGVDPQRLGVTGGSAGGHLSLMLATKGGPGPADAPDPVDRESSAVEAVAIFFPVTDLLNLGTSTENPGDGGPPKSFVKAFGPQSTNLAIWKVTGREMSPIYYIHSNLPPILIVHGDADTLVPLDQSERFLAQAQKFACTMGFVVHHGGKHGWWNMIWDLRRFAGWFDQYLLQPQRN